MDDLPDRGIPIGRDRGDDRLLAALGLVLDQVDAAHDLEDPARAPGEALAEHLDGDLAVAGRLVPGQTAVEA
ncbi:hypothetical protein [Janibacter indicus]|uniref:hypothetical protein n=1 Tax=Janibacter indicus TaxID=857417 RepID=UPI000A02A710|nr:hypothetical protein [Janibacter indicus]